MERTARPRRRPAPISLHDIQEKVHSGVPLTRTDASHIVKAGRADAASLVDPANAIRNAFHGDTVELCAIVNAKSGACTEDCAYCAQSSRYKTDIAVYAMLDRDAVRHAADEARQGGVQRFSIVTSGRTVSKRELRRAALLIGEIRRSGLSPCASLGLLGADELRFLRDSGLQRYHHNLETSERFFPNICSTHTYRQKVATIEAARSAGLSVCSGGIFGMGETWQDRIDMAMAFRDIGVDSVPVNFLIPIGGTPLAGREILGPAESLVIISLLRFMLPCPSIRVCGGRVQALGKLHHLIFHAGADAVMTGNYLTTTGRTFRDDLGMIEGLGLKTCCRQSGPV